jgi:hypothetical protein
MDYGVSNWRIRRDGHVALLGLPIGLVLIAAQRAYGELGFDYLRLSLGVFPAGVGWLCGVIGLESALARGEGRNAIKSSVGGSAIVTFISLLLLLALLWFVKAI